MTQQTRFETYRGSAAAAYERYFVPAVAAPLAGELVEVARLRPGERVLDVACGTGVVTRLAAERVGGAAVAGVDVNPDMLDVARTVSADAAIEWHQASAEALPLGNGTFDVVLCQMGVQFLPDRAGALREMRRVLSPGGRFALNAPGPTPAPFAVLEKALARRAGPEAAGFVAAVFSLHDPDELRALLESSGFVDVQARSDRKALELPPAADFLWQYLHSTPLATLVASLDEEERADLQQEVVAGWKPFVEGDGILLEFDLSTATARRP